MKSELKKYIKTHPALMNALYFVVKFFFDILNVIIPVKKKTILFSSLAGRNFDDSPKALYDEIRNRDYFKDWTLIWAFKEPDAIVLPRGKKIHFGTVSYWFTLLRSQVWIENGGMDLGLSLNYKKHLMIKTWHGTVIKRGEGDENSGAVLQQYRKRIRPDNRSIRCVQSATEIENCMKYFHAPRECFVPCGLPRNDCLPHYTAEQVDRIRDGLNIPQNKKIILYMPTYREYLLNDNNETFFKPPLDLNKWKRLLGERYVFLIRAHYGVTEALHMDDIDDDAFVWDVSKYSPLSDLYAIATLLISDYSSAFFDFSITEKPIRCFAYDYEEYNERRGLLYDLKAILPCKVMDDEDELIDSIIHMDYETDCKKTKQFKEHYAEFFDGHASATLIDILEARIKAGN